MRAAGGLTPAASVPIVRSASAWPEKRASSIHKFFIVFLTGRLGVRHHYALYFADIGGNPAARRLFTSVGPLPAGR